MRISNAAHPFAKASSRIDATGAIVLVVDRPWSRPCSLDRRAPPMQAFLRQGKIGETLAAVMMTAANARE
jgi:hypothetical protein